MITISNAQDELWKNAVPNSPFPIRPDTILALQENEQDIWFLMDTLINEESTYIEANGLELTNGSAKVEILRSQLDGEMGKILSGAGGSCQFCTATFTHDPDIVNEGFPINRSVSDTKILFDEINEEEFLSLTSNQRFNLAHKPISELNLIPSSQLHATSVALAGFYLWLAICTQEHLMVSNFNQNYRLKVLYYKLNERQTDFNYRHASRAY